MPVFRYLAQSSRGERQSGEIEAGSSAEVVDWLREQGLMAIDVSFADAPLSDGQRGPRQSGGGLRQLVFVLLFFGICGAGYYAYQRSQAGEDTTREESASKEESAASVKSVDPEQPEEGAVPREVPEVRDVPTSVAETGQEVIACTEAYRHVGDSVWVSGRVGSSFCLNGMTHLCLGKGNDTFVVRIVGNGEAPSGEPLHRQYRNRDVMVQGTIIEEKGAPCMQVNGTAQIVVLESN